MPWIIAAAVGGSAVVNSAASKSAADAQASASRSAAKLQDKQFYQTREDQMPWMQAGKEALNKLIPLSEYQKFGMDQFEADPGYAFRLAEGQKALDRQAAARGGLISGSALKAASRYGQEMGSQEYQNAFNRYQTERASQLAPLQSLAGIGQTTASNLGALGANNAQAVGNYLTGGANARAAGTVGAANAINSGLGTYINYNQGNNLISAINAGRMSNLGGGAGYGAGYAGDMPYAAS